MTNSDPLREFFQSIGFRVRNVGTGGRYNIYCPLHNEKDASLFIRPSQDDYKCFGQCNSHGKGIINFFRLVNLELAENWNYRLKVLAPTVWLNSLFDEETEEKKEFEVDWKSLGLADLNLPYLQERFITKRTIEAFGIAYHKRFDCLFVPVFDSSGDYSFYIRRNFSSVPKYQNQSKSKVSASLFPIEKLHLPLKDGKLILVEGIFDAIRAHQEGITNCLATIGGALTQGQIRLMGKYTRNIVLCPDRDLQGVSHAESNTKLLKRYGYNIYYTRATGGSKDLAQAKDPTKLPIKSYFELKYEKKLLKDFILN